MNREETVKLVGEMESQLEMMRAFIGGKRIGWRPRGSNGRFLFTACPVWSSTSLEFAILPDPIICHGHVNEYNHLVGSASCGPCHDSPHAQRRHMNEAHGKEAASKMRVVRFIQDMEFVDPTASDDCGF